MMMPNMLPIEEVTRLTGWSAPSGAWHSPGLDRHDWQQPSTSIGTTAPVTEAVVSQKGIGPRIIRAIAIKAPVYVGAMITAIVTTIIARSPESKRDRGAEPPPRRRIPPSVIVVAMGGGPVPVARPMPAPVPAANITSLLDLFNCRRAIRDRIHRGR
jgi:hypothetical protein